MANPYHVEIISKGSKVWNQWRNSSDVKPDLSRISLKNADLSRINLIRTNLRGSNLMGTNLTASDFTDANLRGANLSEAILIKASISRTDLYDADLYQANLSTSYIYKSNFTSTDLRQTDFSYSYISSTQFNNLDLSTTKGLDLVRHGGPSSISIDTFLLSEGKIPKAFLRGCGVPQNIITFMSSLDTDSIEFNSCFISYSHKDEDFAQRLYSALRDKNLRVWYAPEEMKGGEKIHEQIDCAIQMHDRLLLVLSEHSMSSEWVRTEIYNARQREMKEKRRILFPIALAPFEQIRDWKFFDGDSGKDLAREIREYFIPDFSDWKNHDSFENGFGRLLRDLKQATPTI